MKKILTVLLNILLFSTIVYSQPITIQWQKSYGGTWQEWASAIENTNDGGYIVAGLAGSTDGNVTCTLINHNDWVIKLDSMGNIVWQNCYGINYLYCLENTYDGGFIIGGLTYDSTLIGFHGGAYDAILIKIDSLGNTMWEKTYGGDGLECARTIVVGNDSSFIIGGETTSSDGDLDHNYGDSDGWIMKIDSIGNIIWSKSYGGPGVGGEQIRGIITTKDFGYIAAGSSSGVGNDITSNNGLLDFWILKLDMSGNLQWQKNYGGSDYDAGWSITEKASNGYIMAGKTLSNDFDIHGNKGDWDVWILNLDINGDTIGTKTFGGAGGDEANIIKNIGDNFIIGGRSESSDGDVSFNHGFGDCWLFEINLLGNILWEKCFGGSQNEWILDFEQTNDGFVFSGAAASNDGDLTANNGYEDFWIVRLADVTVDIPTIVNETYLSIFPNPVIDIITIETSPQTSIEISNIQGQIIKKINNIKKESTIDLTNYSSGVYILKAKTDKGITIKKFIKE